MVEGLRSLCPQLLFMSRAVSGLSASWIALMLKYLYGLNAFKNSHSFKNTTLCKDYDGYNVSSLTFSRSPIYLPKSPFESIVLPCELTKQSPFEKLLLLEYERNNIESCLVS